MIGKDKAEKLKDQYLILPLDQVSVDGKPDRAYCVVTNEQIPIDQVVDLQKHINLHNDFIHQMDADNYSYCISVIPNLKGLFGGELDTFYEEVLKRITSL